MDRVVEARFLPDGTGWSVALVEPARDGHTERALGPSRRWVVPRDPDKLFLALVPRDRCGELHGLRVRLRVRPDTLDPDAGPMPSVVCWPAMYDPVGLHMYLKGWTLAEMCACEASDPWPFDGSVTVLDDPTLATQLRAEGVATVLDAGRQSPAWRAGTVLVVTGRLAHTNVTALQQRALRAKSPLVVWTDTLPAQAGEGLLELVPTGDRAEEPTARFLSRLVTHLRAGRDPEVAVALSATEQPPRDLRARWLRGTFRPWRSPPRADADERLRYWRYQIDRSVQQTALTGIVNDLVAAEDTRRVHVVVVRGAEGAGVDYFRRRPVDLRADLADRVRTVHWEPPWAEQPAETFDKLIEWNDATDRASLVLRLVEHARTGTLLVRCVHPTATAELTVTSLRAYLGALKDLATALDRHPVRLLVMCCVVTDDPGSFEALEDDGDAACAVSVLGALEPFIPDDELWDFLKLKGVVATRAEFAALKKEMGRLPYEELVPWLAHRFPDRLATR